jgi:hypothetical protein
LAGLVLGNRLKAGLQPWVALAGLVLGNRLKAGLQPEAT